MHKQSSRSRSVKIHVEHDGTVVVTTPPRFPVVSLPRYVEEARAWIEKRLLEVKLKPQLLSDTLVYYFGEPHPIEVTNHQDGSVHIRDGKLYLAPLTQTAIGSKLLLEKWLRNRCVEHCLVRLEVLSAKMKTKYAGVRFKQQKTCWGSCSSDHNLNFNWRLIHAPSEVIDYVIIHELAHTVHLNHGRAFWDLVAKHDPDHPLHRGWLKRFGSTTE